MTAQTSIPARAAELTDADRRERYAAARALGYAPWPAGRIVGLSDLWAVKVAEDEYRRTAIVTLAREADEKPPWTVRAELAVRAHPSLPAARRAELWEEYYDLTRSIAALDAGIADWSEYYLDLTCPDRQQTAGELLDDRAREVLYALVHGENGEKS